MEVRRFKIGDRVRAIKPVDGLSGLVGKTGTVVKCVSDGWDIAVEFDEPFDKGHTCYNQCRNHHGRFGFKDQFELCEIEDSPLQILFSFDELWG